MKSYDEEDPERQALQDLMEAMSGMRQKRVKGLAPLPFEGAPEGGMMGEEEEEEMELPEGMDSRLAEIIRKKKSGRA